MVSQKVQDRELKESEKKFQVLTENINDVFWMATPGIRETAYISPAYKRIWGQDPRRLYSDPRAFIEAIHPEEQQVVRKGIKHHERGVWDFEYRIVCPDGSIRWISDRGFPVFDAEGRVLRMCGVATDITKSKKTQEALRTARDELESRLEKETERLRAANLRLQMEIEARKQLECALSRLILGLEAFRKTGSSFTTLTPETLMEHVKGRHKRAGEEMESFERLSLREREVFAQLAEGESIKVIAARLHISAKTVETHKYNIMDKLGVSKTFDLTKLAIKYGLIKI